MTRAIYSQRQLQQVMDDFWLNHFNVFAGKGEVKWYLTSYERDVIEPHTLGKFKDLLTATAKSPATNGANTSASSIGRPAFLNSKAAA